jgi:tRNA threonylcarbamoyladenosine biosynthesis protein TsaE
MPIYQSQSEEETAALAVALAQACQGGNVFLLQGPLGAGKSLFARAFIQSLSGEETNVPSPTFTLVQTYDTPKGALYHFDLYRLKSPEEVFELGWEEALDGRSIALIEWPEQAGPYLPQDARTIKITPQEGSQREIAIDE